MFNTHYQPHYHPTTKILWLCSSVYCRPPHQSRRIWLVAAATNQKGPGYTAVSIAWLLMAWWRQEQGHQQPWYWPCSPGIFQFQHRKGEDRNFLLYRLFDLWYQWEILNLADNTPNTKMPSEVTSSFDKLEDLNLAWEYRSWTNEGDGYSSEGWLIEKYWKARVFKVPSFCIVTSITRGYHDINIYSSCQWIQTKP